MSYGHENCQAWYARESLLKKVPRIGWLFTTIRIHSLTHWISLNWLGAKMADVHFWLIYYPIKTATIGAML